MSSGDSTTTQLNIPGPTSEEQQLTQLQIQLGESQLSAIKQQTALQEQLVSELGPLQELQAAEAERALAEAERTGPIREELLNLALEDIRRGGAATPEEIRLIEEAGAAGLAGGEINIERFETEALGKLREELAPSLGLRPSDTPILDRGGVVAAEALRQKGTLSAAIQQSGATARLNFPLARSQLIQAGVGAQQTLQESVRQFQEQLRTQAFINRLNLTGQTAGLGLGLATGFQPNLAGQSNVLGGIRLAGAPQTTTTSQGFFPTLFQGISAVGGGLQGIGAVTNPSSREVKTDKRILDEEDIAEKVIDLPVESWRYIGDEKEHVGPYAEDFTEAFGLGDSRTIDLRDLAGVTMAAVKGLGKKIERLEGKGFGLEKEAA
ncbi:hypothetical protein LCGC14_1769290 [marine sediment metagenome]|uniref:Peptidase S74 domain-containing protein n=1 Tax=marine sediment metagenome TaxID=412755 RepID=A0A0F9GYQ1_9ZZZZ